MKILTFQNYRLLDDIKENGIVYNKVRREWIEEKSGCVAIDKLTRHMNNKVGTCVKNPIFGICDIVSKIDLIGEVRELTKFIASCPGMLDEVIGVDLLDSAKVLLCLDVPEDMVLKFDQYKLNSTVRVFSNRPDGLENMIIDDSLDVSKSPVTSCALPYIKKEWITDVYKIAINPETIDVLLLHTNIELDTCTLDVAYTYSDDSAAPIYTTKAFSTIEYNIMKILTEHDNYTGWEFCEEFNQDLFEKYLSNVVNMPLDWIKSFKFKIDESNVAESIFEIFNTIDRYLCEEEEY